MRAPLLAAVVLLGSCGGATPGLGGHACTEIGCFDAFTATLHDANGTVPAGMHTLTVTADGVTAMCAFTVPLATLPGGGTAGIDCPGGLQVSVIPASNCTATMTDGAEMLSCTPVAGKLDERLTIAGKPGTLHVTQAVDGAVILDETVTPTYALERPNGPGCDPVCAQAGATWVLAPR